MDKADNHKKRQHNRHPAGVPIEIGLNEVVASKREYLINISRGGLCFQSNIFLTPGTRIHITVPLIRPVFNTWARVAWCKQDVDTYAVGVTFEGKDEPFKTRMVAQICDIEKYKKIVARKEHRKLTSEEAALEWIKKYAATFPRE
jgi:hypothetical protein